MFKKSTNNLRTSHQDCGFLRIIAGDTRMPWIRKLTRQSQPTLAVFINRSTQPCVHENTATAGLTELPALLCAALCLMGWHLRHSATATEQVCVCCACVCVCVCVVCVCVVCCVLCIVCVVCCVLCYVCVMCVCVLCVCVCVCVCMSVRNTSMQANITKVECH